MQCPVCQSKLGRNEALKVALMSEATCPDCGANIHLESAKHRYIVLFITFGCAVLVGYMAKSEGGDFLVSHLFGFVIGAILASGYLQIFGRLCAKD